MRAARLFTLASIVLFACGRPDAGRDEGENETASDAGATTPEDAGRSGAPDDAGTATVADAGPSEPVDAGPALPEDAGPAVPLDAGAAVPLDAGTPPGPVLEVSVTGARNANGRTCLAIFDDGAAFPSNAARAVFNQCFTSVAGPFRIDGLVDGRTYGISIFHDENSNSALDTQNVIAVAVPKEGIGFSNNPSIGFGAPSWEQVKFTFDAAHRSMALKLTYLL